MTLSLKKIISLLFILIFLTPLIIKAITLPNPLEWDTIEEVIEGIIDFIFWAAIVITPLMIIVGALFFITSAGNPDRVRTAKNILFWTIIGFAIVLLAKGIISMVREIIGG